MIVNFILMFKGVEGVDKYLAKHSEYFMNKNYKQTWKFMQKYLNHEFKERENNFVFLDYLDNSNIEGEVYPDLIRNSKFFKTMNDKGYLDFIDAYLSSCGEERIINDCVENIFDLSVLKDLVTDYVTDNNAASVADKLLFIEDMEEDMDLILASNGYWYYLQDYLNEGITEYGFTLEDIKNYLLNYSNHNDEVIRVITNYIEKNNNDLENALIAIADIINIKTKELEDPNTKYYIKEELTDYLDKIFLDLNSNTFYTKDNIDYIAKEIEKTENKETIMEWVINTECHYNYKIIDNLMEDCENLPKLFNAKDKFYVNYITTRILMGKSKEEKYNFMKYLSQHYDLFKKEVLDKVLFLAYTCSYKLSKEEILGFVLKGSRYLREIFHRYDFSEEERLLIFETYKNNQDIDLCTLYGTYLIKGVKTALLSDEEENKMKPLVLSLKKSK